MSKITSILVFVAISTFTLIGCQEQPNFFRNDYSDVPPLPDTTNAISETVTPDGIRIYVVEEGDPESFAVTIRDNIEAYFTVYQAETDQILQSSYANGVTSAQRIGNVGNQGVIEFVGDNLYSGISGMQSGERRVLIYPEELNITNGELIIDFELDVVIY